MGKDALLLRGGKFGRLGLLVGMSNWVFINKIPMERVNRAAYELVGVFIASQLRKNCWQRGHLLKEAIKI